MRIGDVVKLRTGDQVTWTDPDKGICTRTFTIASIWFDQGVIKITDTEGGELECYPRELS